MKGKKVLAIGILLSIIIIIIINVKWTVHFKVSDDEYNPGVEIIECELVNNTIHPVYYGDLFTVEILKDKEWILFDEKQLDIRFESRMSKLWPFNSAAIRFPVGIYSDFVSPGMYRVSLGIEYMGEKRFVYYEFCVL